MKLFYNIIIFILFTVINLTNELKLVPYWVRIKTTIATYEYKDQSFLTVESMVKYILLKLKSRNPSDVCLYNVGFRRKAQVIRNYFKVCESLLSYINTAAQFVTYYVEHPYHRNEYYCNGKKFKAFESALEYSQIVGKSIKFEPFTSKPAPAPKNFFIETLNGPKFYIRNPSTYQYWKIIWKTCQVTCFYEGRYGLIMKLYADELNNYRKFLGIKPLSVSMKLNKLAEQHAERMAKKGILLFDTKSHYYEVVFLTSAGYGMYGMKIIFDDVYFAHTSRIGKSPRVDKGFIRLFTPEQHFVGIGFGISRYGIFVCIKFTPML
uniref:SCP domain-containing protein n=1 Tax=Strongyloides venezuelensis TaxID=75913 RepID=A0A0K0FIX8_STRVS